MLTTNAIRGGKLSYLLRKLENSLNDWNLGSKFGSNRLWNTEGVVYDDTPTLLHSYPFSNSTEASEPDWVARYGTFEPGYYDFLSIFDSSDSYGNGTLNTTANINGTNLILEFDARITNSDNNLSVKFNVGPYSGYASNPYLMVSLPGSDGLIKLWALTKYDRLTNVADTNVYGDNHLLSSVAATNFFPTGVSDDTWHTVKIESYKKKVTVWIDGIKVIEADTRIYADYQSGTIYFQGNYSKSKYGIPGVKIRNVKISEYKGKEALISLAEEHYFTEDFEDPSFQYLPRTGAWTTTTSVALSGTTSLSASSSVAKESVIGSMTIYADSENNILEFYVKVDSQYDYHDFYAKVNGATKLLVEGMRDWTAYRVELPKGTHKLEFELYTNYEGPGTAYVDLVSLITPVLTSGARKSPPIALPNRVGSSKIRWKGYSKLDPDYPAETYYTSYGTGSLTCTGFDTIADNFTMEVLSRPDPNALTYGPPAEGENFSTSSNYHINHVISAYTQGPDVNVGIAVASDGVIVTERGVDFSDHKFVLVHMAPIADWTRVSVVYRQGTPYLYLNGKFIKSGVTTAKKKHPSVGLYNDSWGTYSGDFNDYRIWDYALSSAEILANSNKILQGSPKGLVHSYRATAGEYIQDLSGDFTLFRSGGLDVHYIGPTIQVSLNDGANTTPVSNGDSIPGVDSSADLTGKYLTVIQMFEPDAVLEELEIILSS